MMPYKDDYETIQGLWMLGVSNEHLSISGAGESKSGRGESWWSGMEILGRLMG